MGKIVKVGIIGCGSIGGFVLQEISEGRVPGKEIAVICEPNPDAPAVEEAGKLGIPVVKDAAEIIDYKPDIVVECAGQPIVRKYAKMMLDNGISFIPMSLGALVDDELRESLKQSAEDHNCMHIVPSGGVGAFDALQGAMVTGLDSVQMITRKPPVAWKDIEYVEEMGIDLDHVTEPILLFDGVARDCVTKFPANINIAAGLSLATVGFDKTRVTIYADPGVVYNTHKIIAKGDVGELTFLFENKPVPTHPKTAYLACNSLVATLRRFGTSYRVGT